MAKTSRSNPDDGSRSVVSRSERYQLLEKKRLIAATPPWIVTKVVRDKKSATSTQNDDVFSPLSTATLATSPEPHPWIEWAQIEEQLSPTIEEKDDDDNSNDDGNSNDNANVGIASQMPLMDPKNLQFSLEDRDYSKTN